jgi:hypothetical protein
MKMATDAQILENILAQAKRLSPEHRLHFIQKIVQTLMAPAPTRPQHIRFGEFGGDEASMSTLEDFAVAEWRPIEI